MLRAVLFDLDGTLLDREICIRKCIESQFAKFADQLEPIAMPEFVALFIELDQRGYAPKPEVYDRMQVELEFPFSLSKALTDDYFQTYPTFCAGFRNLAEILDWLQQKGQRLAVVTNGSASLQSAVIQALGIQDFFDIVVISEVEGVRKPDRRIFDLTLGRLGVAHADAVFVGDHPETDIRGAQKAGIRAIWKRDDYWGLCPFADGVIDDLDELPQMLSEFGLDSGASDFRQHGKS